VANVDLDQLAGVAEPNTITWKGESYRLADDLDLGGLRPILEGIEAAKDDEGVKILNLLWDFARGCFFDEAEFKRFEMTKPGPRVLLTLAKELPGIYGFKDLGESSASPSSSDGTGTESTPTSVGSTDGAIPAPTSGEQPTPED